MVEASQKRRTERSSSFSFPVRPRRPSVADLAADPHVFTLANPPKSFDKTSMAFATRYKISELPKYELPDESLDPRTAYRLVVDEMSLDGNPTLNLATFVTTWMEEEALQLVIQTVGKNMADHNIYPQTIEIQNRCVQILAHLFHSPEVDNKREERVSMEQEEQQEELQIENEEMLQQQQQQSSLPTSSTFSSVMTTPSTTPEPLDSKTESQEREIRSGLSEPNGTGTCCIGSSEALMLCALAMKKKWQHQRRQKGLSTDRPNMIMSSSVQVAWKKFCCYFDVEPKYVPLTPERYVMDVDMALDLIDENTIGVVMMLGSTYTGHYEPIKQMNDKLLRFNEEKGFDVGIHVDAASGGFVAPFLSPDLEWDFRLPLVKSINVSGHKYGLVYPGVGWCLWRQKSDLPRDMVFDLHYLGGVESTASLNFSRPASQMILQYYNFLRLGREGYTTIMENCRNNANYLTERLKEMEVFDILSDQESVPLVAFKLKDHITNFTVYDLASKLRESGWILPAYTLSENAEGVKLLRAVIRESFSQDLAELLCRSLAQAIAYFKVKERLKPITQKEEVSPALKHLLQKIPSELKQELKEETTLLQKEVKASESILHKFFFGLRQKLPRAGDTVC